MDKKLLFTIILIFIIGKGFGQVGIGTTTPRAALDISNDSNGGLLIPEYSLLSTTDATTVVNLSNGNSPAEGTMIFNTNASLTGISRGFVYWDGGEWNNVAAVATSGTPQYGQMFKTTFQNLGASNQIIQFERNGLSSSDITVNSNYIETGTQTGVYEFSYSLLVGIDGNPSNSAIIQDLFFLNQGSGINIVPDSEIIASLTTEGVWATFTKTILVDVNSPNQRFYIFSRFNEPFMTVGPNSKLSVKLIEAD
ncbi:hypothetical protein [Dokdonia sp. Hel_I_53]|uniref:hypothetical protein n=1 Tax=Dokdonia sp. Hel_I_53 TaxID=1566287 RepID=UPI00119C013E|nr:hypothetical protein [Dokdonia sp. Hel_I_53]TVZ50950.1 hypothetical protein OD90_0084 [Dokdonia sp. Hel_I_53]